MRAFLPLAFLIAIGSGCGKHAHPPSGEPSKSTSAALLPLSQPDQYVPRRRETVYVPVFSSIDIGFDRQVMDLSATMAIRNVSTRHPLIIHSVKYFDSGGREVRQYVSKASVLPPMAVADFVIQRRDTSGGRGASFLVEWSSAEEIDDPLVEAVMIGHQGDADISFTSRGRVLSREKGEAAPQTAVPPRN